MVYQLSCTLISVLLNLILLFLIWKKSPPQTGKYRWLMAFTAIFEIFWGAFGLPADVMSHSVGCAVISFRINYPGSILSAEQSAWLVVIFTSLFGASLAVFASHFIYRYGCIAGGICGQFTVGWKFSLLFISPIFYCFWWGAVIRIWFWKNTEMDNYTRDIIYQAVHLPIENVSYVGTKFYNFDQIGTISFNRDAWIAVGQMWFMVGSSMACVFGFGILCYIRLSESISMISNASHNLQKQLFYSLVLQTLIPIVLMHTPITIFLIFPILNMGADMASTILMITIALYPAVDPIPIFFIIKSYRKAILDVFRRLLCSNQGSAQVGVAPNNSTLQ